MEDLGVKTDNWYKVFEYNESIKDLVGEIQGCYSRISINSSKFSSVEMTSIKDMMEKAVKSRNDLISGTLTLKTREDAENFVNELNEVLILMGKIESSHS